jgi:toxin ParE1/3/4
MANFKLTNKAVQDLKQNWNYTFENCSEKQADKYYREIIKHCSKVADKPTTGKQYEHLVRGLRGAKVNKHIIFYRQLNQNEIEIERVLHERMDMKSRLLHE